MVKNNKAEGILSIVYLLMLLSIGLLTLTL